MGVGEGAVRAWETGRKGPGTQEEGRGRGQRQGSGEEHPGGRGLARAEQVGEMCAHPTSAVRAAASGARYSKYAAPRSI